MKSFLTKMTFMLGMFFWMNTMGHAQEPLTVHEWGTITTHHYNNGRAAGGLNRIGSEEVLPDFVHKLDTTWPETSRFSKGAVGDGHQAVTMRLETPVIYFYPSDDFDFSQTFDVDVKFKSGLINEYYPNAEASYLGDIATELMGFDLTKNTIGKLAWQGIKLGGPWKGPETQNLIWLAPRAVDASDIQTSSGESERYLFYRGVAHTNNLMFTKHDVNKEKNSLYIYDPLEEHITQNAILRIAPVWLVIVKADGSVAYKQIGPIQLTTKKEEILKTVSLEFDAEEYAQQNVERLRSEMFRALVDEGLFDQEAEAMLNTWESYYFKKAGKRILYIVPQEWMEFYLPLKFSIPVDLTRVFVGRIDLI